MRPICLLFFLLQSVIPPLMSYGQELKYLDLYTKRLIERGLFPKKEINLLVQGNLNHIRHLIALYGGRYKYGYKDIAAVTIPLERFDDFVSAEGIISFENADLPVAPLAEQAIILNNVLPVHQGLPPLDQPYTGQGVIMGIIDDGIDFGHGDFLHADSSTRIRFLWDQRAPNINSPFPYGYGREWSAQEINAGICTHSEPVYNPGGYSSFGHGTTVAGIACGNGRATGRYKGMAPDTDIIYVAINEQRNFLSTIIDAVDYIFKKADALGKPCVINISYGTYFGSRDGRDLASRMIDYLLSERHGRALVAAAGNAGHLAYHLGYEVTTDTSFTWFRKIPNDVDAYFALWADTADFHQVHFAFGADDWSNNVNTFLNRTPFLTIKGFYNLNPGFVDVVQQNFSLNDSFGNPLATIRTQITHDKGRYLYEVIILPANVNHLWRFITTGSGKFDIWSSTAVMGTSDMVSVFPNDSTFAARVPGIQHYKFPDTKKTMVSSFQNSDKVITVANYVNRSWYLNARYNPLTMRHDTTFTGLTTGALYYTSSRGPTRDNRQKPDIAATGTFTLATGNRNHIQITLSANNYIQIADDSLHNRNGGTSMASPCVAGAVALYLQKKPEAWWYETKAAIITTAARDTFTGNNLPDPDWGYGKLNAFDAMMTNLTYGCTDTAAINYDPNAVFDDASCIPKRYGCMDPNALNYDSLANINDTCVYYVFQKTPLLHKHHLFTAYPNPAREKITFQYDLEQNTTAHIEIFNLLGYRIASITLPEPKGTILLNVSAFTPGTYYYSLYINQKQAFVNRFSVF